MFDISVITFTLGGRDRYLFKCIDSVYQKEIDEQYIYEVDCTSPKIEHHLIFQGTIPSPELKQALSVYRESGFYKLIIHEWPTNIGIGAGLNKILAECKGELIFKMDDDCEIVSKDFFGRAYALHKRFPNSCFSPFVVGLIRNVGGATGFKHSVWHDKQNNNVYTRRHTTHLGGISRFSPAHIIKNFTFQNDLIKGISGVEDTDFSQYCNNKKIEMFYLENDLIVQHADSTLGQIVRYPDYFKDRKYEGSLKIEVIE